MKRIKLINREKRERRKIFRKIKFLKIIILSDMDSKTKEVKFNKCVKQIIPHISKLEKTKDHVKILHTITKLAKRY